jgi:hypothetical protein
LITLDAGMVILACECPILQVVMCQAMDEL